MKNTAFTKFNETIGGKMVIDVFLAGIIISIIIIELLMYYLYKMEVKPR